MKRSGLIIATALTLLLTGFVFARAGLPRRANSDSIRGRRTFSGDMAIRFRQGQPSHWRAFLLQH
jgi:hypothetical protein